MKIPICNICNIPLRIRDGYVGFRCMCDEDIRIIPYEYISKCKQIKILDKNDEISELFISSFLTMSKKCVI
jgi:hypothetical protein